MMEYTLNYEQYIYDTKECHIGKLNMRDYKTNKLFVLCDIDEFNYFDIIKFVLIDKFKSLKPDLVRFIIGSITVLFENLKFSDLENKIEHGYIFNIIL